MELEEGEEIQLLEVKIKPQESKIEEIYEEKHPE